MLYLLLLTYGTILLSELLGDKSIYAISSLSMRFHALYVVCGFTAAFMLKMFVAVLLGQVIAELPRSIIAGASAATFFLTAILIWYKKSNDDESARREDEGKRSKAALITFAALFFSEWGDMGQIMAGTLTARYGVPLLIWTGATLALVTKGLLALALGRGLRKHIPLYMLRPLSAGLCVIMGFISAIQPVFNARASMFIK
jgi:putative Ca2+/H+ antiporter (TMEM165/GDT1 family)